MIQTSATTNPEPYCAELYNARELPYGFFSFDLPQLFGEGFPVFFDINLSADEVQTFYQYVEEGLYYDSNTRCTLLTPPILTPPHLKPPVPTCQLAQMQCIQATCCSDRTHAGLYSCSVVLLTRIDQSCGCWRMQVVASTVCDIQPGAANLLLLHHQL